MVLVVPLVEDYTIPRTVRELQPTVTYMRVDVDYTIPRTVRELQHPGAELREHADYTIPRTVRELQRRNQAPTR